MGRWLTALKKHDSPPETNRQNRQNPGSDSSVSFVSPHSEGFANFSDCRIDNGKGVLSVLSVPVSRESEISPAYRQADFEERAAILEYNADLSRADAERQAAMETRQIRPVSPQTDAELYADALRQIEPCGYGPVAVFLGWGAGRASAAECELRQAGKIAYDHTGRGRLVNI